jgi:hypothetical protein
MPTRPIRDDVVADPVVGPVTGPAIGDGRPLAWLATMPWFRRLPDDLRLPPGVGAPDLLRVPERDATAMLVRTVHRVADIPAASPPTVVWTLGRDELLVRLDRTALACVAGIVTVRVTVACDEVRGDTAIDVPFAVGSAQRPAGLLMSTIERLAGPPVIVQRWSDTIAAFAWEALVATAQALAAAVGRDASGRPLVPGAIAAERGLLLLAPTARHRLEWRDVP